MLMTTLEAMRHSHDEEALRGYRGTVLRTTLSKEQQAKVEATPQGR
jgi:hypothetical protein